MSNFPTLDGLNNIDGDNGNLTNITCQTFIATVSAQAPTMASGNISNNIATTEFVDDAITNATANLVTTDTTQTLTTGTKFFTNLPECATLATTANQFTNKSYVDNAVGGVGSSAVLLAGNQTLTTGIKTFTNLPQSTAIPSANSDLTNKLYIDTNFVDISGTQTILGNKNFTGNNTFNCATGTNIIKGNQVDIFPTITYLTSPTTSVAGTNFNMNSTTNYISGTITYLASPTIVVNSTCNSFYVDASYSNFVGDNTLLQSPYTAITATVSSFVNDSLSTIINSPYMAITSACSSLNLNATNTTITGNTNMTGSVVTATTQASSDNSTKIATTAFVNAYATANYMTINTNQSIPTAIKTYGGKQVFNAGTACSTYDNTSLTDMTLASNSESGILSIAGTRMQTDTYGVRLALQRRNLQLSEGTVIQPNNAVGFNDYTKPDFAFGVNKITGYVDIVGVPNSAQGSIQMNNLAGIFSWFAGYNQTTTFTISHSIITTSTAIASMNEAEVYFYFQDFNTGIIRYTTPNLATTTGFALPANSTVVRPIITFDLTTAQLPQGDYRIFGYSRVTNAYAVNAGVLSVNFGLPASPSTETAIQNYNTPINYTFTSRNLYHCFRNYVAGVFHVNVIGSQQNLITPLFYSVTDYANIFTQASTSGALTVPAVTGGTVVGNWSSLSVNNSENLYILLPNYSIIVYNLTGWSGTIYLNAKNNTNNPIIVAPTTISAGSSCKIYFDEVELIKY